jgi:hypothetical protein
MKTICSTRHQYLQFGLFATIIFLLLASCKKESTNDARNASSENISNDTAIITNGLVAWYTVIMYKLGQKGKYFYKCGKVHFFQ